MSWVGQKDRFRQTWAVRAVGVAIAIALAGCGDSEHEDLRQWMRDASKDLRGKIAPLPEVKPYEPEEYRAGDLVPPFDATRVVGAAKAAVGSTGNQGPDLNRPREPLEEFPLETMRFVGFFQDKKRLVAQILVNGKTHELRVGNYIGQNFGRVTRIVTDQNEERIMLKEVIQEPDGAWVERESELLLSEGGGR